MKSLIVKSLVVFVLLLTPYMYVSNAEYLDNEISTENSFSATFLDLELKDMSNNQILSPLFENQKIKKDEEIEKQIKIVNNGGITFYYWTKYELKGGEEEVCTATNLVAKRDSVQVYDGPLSNFDLSTQSAQLTGVEDVWSFVLKNENTNSSIQNENCEFDLKFMAFQNSYSTGFSDEENLGNKIIFPFEPTISLFHNTASYQLEVNLGNLNNFLSFDYVLDYDTDSLSDHVENSENLSGENSKTIEVDLGTASDGILVPYINPHNFILNIEFTDINNDIINYQEEL